MTPSERDRAQARKHLHDFGTFIFSEGALAEIIAQARAEGAREERAAIYNWANSNGEMVARFCERDLDDLHAWLEAREGGA